MRPVFHSILLKTERRELRIMKMKKISKLISLSVIMCLLISSLCVLNVSASDTEPTLLFDLDMSGFEKGQENESWGLTGSGDDADTTVIMAREGHIKDSKTATGSTTLKTFVNVKGEEVSYINQGLANSGNSGRSSTTENSRIHIENEGWNDKATTMEIWVNQKSKASGGAYLNFYVDDADSDRVTYDYNMRVLKGYNPAENKFNLYEDTDGVNNTTATVTNSYYYYKTEESTWYMHTVVATPIDTDNDGTNDTMKYKLYIDDATSDDGYMELTVPITEGNTYGVLLGQVRKNNYASPSPLKIGSVKVYDGALSTEQIAAHYNAEAENFTALLCEETVYADDESFMIDLTDITDELPNTEQGTLTLGGEEIEAEFSYDEETKKISVTPCDYLLGGNYYILSFGNSLSGAIRVNVKTSTIEVEDVSYSGDAVDYTITGDGTERQIMVLAVGYDATGELLTGAVYEKYVLSGTDAEPKTLSAPKLVDANSIKFMVWEICDGYTRPLADIIEIE